MLQCALVWAHLAAGESRLTRGVAFSGPKAAHGQAQSAPSAPPGAKVPQMLLQLKGMINGLLGVI